MKQLLMNKQESTGLKLLNDSTAFTEYLNYIDIFTKILKNIIQIMIADMPSNKKLNPIVTELFIRGIKLNISLIFITQSYFAVPKKMRLNSTHYFIMKIPNKQELQQIAFNHSSEVNFRHFMYLYKNCAAKPYSFLVIDTTLASDNPLRFRKNLLERI